ncbi:MAG: nickel pincer cofactor biosynthesis protein LarB [Rhodospirillales bacterium]|jgi:NCAIR mutase (PurE)-related protein
MAPLTFDHDRASRIGIPECVICEHKAPEHIDVILATASGKPLLLTRLAPQTRAALKEPGAAALDYDPLSCTAIAGVMPPLGPYADIALVTAGTSDEAVAREVERTLNFFGRPARRISDVGVAGLWRILEQRDDIAEFPIVIVVAGMDGALVSVLGGLVGSAIIAVPTSTGYGAAEGGRTALNSALTSCAPGVLVCNIDNGFGAACAAHRIARQFDNFRGIKKTA